MNNGKSNFKKEELLHKDDKIYENALRNKQNKVKIQNNSKIKRLNKFTKTLIITLFSYIIVELG
ncbi:hypothetical protein EHP00_1257 [Ecytonucleospora hepatopenaei]|uniref:Uncharacterized protein n=1 Tax=Ecytonucleospora hepatopenaei TaxID=646526 RepID=A0A1W0E3H7_9MICR|nr:hypothetical protein EHP00_1257 [Ecytonucleospora hepatopenaei]